MPVRQGCYGATRQAAKMQRMPPRGTRRHRPRSNCRCCCRQTRLVSAGGVIRELAGAATKSDSVREVLLTRCVNDGTTAWVIRATTSAVRRRNRKWPGVASPLRSRRVPFSRSLPSFFTLSTCELTWLRGTQQATHLSAHHLRSPLSSAVAFRHSRLPPAIQSSSDCTPLALATKLFAAASSAAA